MCDALSSSDWTVRLTSSTPVVASGDRHLALRQIAARDPERHVGHLAHRPHQERADEEADGEPEREDDERHPTDGDVLRATLAMQLVEREADAEAARRAAAGV